MKKKIKTKYELLRKAAAIIDGIPEKAVKLDDWQTRKGETLSCGTVCCAGGWLGLHPYFNAIGLELKASSVAPRAFPHFKGEVLRGQGYITIAAALGLSADDAARLFRPRIGSDQHYGMGISDKELFRRRVQYFLKEQGEELESPE